MLESNFLSRNEADFHFSLLTNRESIFPFLSGIKKCQNYGDLKVHRLGPNITGVLNGFSSAFRLKSQALQNLTLLRLFSEAKAWFMLKDVDVFHLHGCWGNLYETLALMLSKYCGKPLVVSLHGTYFPGPEAMPIPSRVTLNILKYAKAIITHNMNVMNKLRELKLDHKSHLIPIAIDAGYFNCSQPLNARSRTKAIFVGRLTPHTDPITPILAFQYVHKMIPEAQLYIVGNGPLFKQLEVLIRQLHLERSVILTGAQRNVREFLHSSKIFLATSPITNYPSVSLLEALASSLAVIATDTGETRNIIYNRKNGILVPAKNPRELAKALCLLMTDQELCDSLSKNALKTAEKYDIRISAPKFAKICRFLCEQIS